MRGERWFGFEAVQALKGLPPEILLVALPGHTEGQVGVAVQRGEDGWLLHAADSYFFRHEMDFADPWRPIGTRAYQRMMAVDLDLFDHNQSRLREVYGRRSGMAVFCTHDPVEFEALAQRSPVQVGAAERSSGRSDVEGALVAAS